MYTYECSLVWLPILAACIIAGCYSGLKEDEDYVVSDDQNTDASDYFIYIED